MFDIDYRREVFRWAAERVQAAVRESTWQAFWLSTVEDLPPREVARRLGLSVGSVYIARSRVMARLREEVRRSEEGPTASGLTWASDGRGSSRVASQGVTRLRFRWAWLLPLHVVAEQHVLVP